MGPQHPARGVATATPTDPPGPPKIQLRGVSVFYGGTAALRRVSLAVQAHRVTALIASWPAPDTLAEARATLRTHLAEIEAAAEAELARWGAPYGAKAYLGDVPFPAKTFGGRTYLAIEQTAGNNTFTDATDLLLDITGATGAIATSNFI